MFVDNLATLTPKEEAIFNLYVQGCSTKDIISQLGITENTLKYHNKNIYSKLGVKTRKELLQYIELMRNAEHWRTKASKRPPASLLVGGFLYGLGVTISILTLSLILSLTLSLTFMPYIAIHTAKTKYPI